MPDPARVTGTNRHTDRRLAQLATEVHATSATPPFQEAPPPRAIPEGETLAATQAEAVRALGQAELGVVLPSRYPGADGVTLDERLSRQILLLAQIHCTYDEISAVTEVSTAGLHDHCRALIDLGRSRGKAALRRRQYAKAVEEGNVQMLVWLGKNLLGQADRAVATLEDGNTNTNSGAVDPDAPEVIAEQAEQVLTELRARVATIRQNLTVSTQRAEEARRAAGAAHAVPELEAPLVDVRRLPPPPPETQQTATARRGPHFIPHNQSLTPNTNLPRR